MKVLEKAILFLSFQDPVIEEKKEKTAPNTAQKPATEQKKQFYEDPTLAEDEKKHQEEEEERRRIEEEMRPHTIEVETPTGDAIGELPSLPASAVPPQPATAGVDGAAATDA